MTQLSKSGGTPSLDSERRDPHDEAEPVATVASACDPGGRVVRSDRWLAMKDETCRFCGQPYAHLFGCTIKPSDPSRRTWRCPDTFPTKWLRPNQRTVG